MSVKMSNKSKTNDRVNKAETSSGDLSTNRCPIGEQDGFSYHLTTADRRARRRKWSQEEDRVVMQCYRELYSGGRDYEITEEAHKFWGSIWGERKHRKDAEWLKNFKDFEYKEEQEEVEITPEKIKMLRKMLNWKVPGPDYVQGFWLKYFTSLQKP